MSSSPGWASTERPSTVMVTFVRITSVMGASSVVHVGHEIVAEHAQRGVDRRRDRRTQHADGGLLRRPGQSRGDVVAEVEQQVEVLHTSATVFEAVQHALD